MKKTKDSPANVYKNLVSRPSCSSDHQPVLAPRNVKQVHNAQASQRQEFRLSHDAYIICMRWHMTLLIL